ncbi:MAG: DUF4340 domain-containing protein, partial [Pseudomonadota bacterium]
VVKEKHGYPARFDRVKKALVGLADLTLFEAKTGNPERFSKLNLADPAGGKKTDSRLLTVKDKDGKVLAAIVIGRENTNSAVFGKEMVYVRQPDKKRAWLALGNPDVTGDALAWTRKEITDIGKDRIRQTVLTPAKGEAAIIGREKPTDKDFGVKDVPDGFKEKSKRLIAAVPGVLEDLDLSDVRPAKDIDFAKNAAGEARFETFDGIVLTMRMAKVDKDIWLTVAARFDPAKAVKPAAKDKDSKDKDSKIKSAADAKKEAAEIAARTAGWAYKVSKTNERFLGFKKADLMDKKKQEKKKPGDKKDDKKPK